MKLRIIISCLFLICHGLLLAQDPDVDLFTGAPKVGVPIWTVNSKDLSHPVSLTYSGGGVKVDAIAGKAGIGWNLRAGGLVTRELRGLPDEYSIDGDNPRKGWIETNNHTTIGNLNFLADDDFSDCSDEAADWTNLDQLDLFGSTMIDTEPDLFHVNTPGLSFSFVFDNDGQIRTIPYANVSVEYEESNHKITSFEITDSQGNIYSFGSPINSGIKMGHIPGEDPSLFSRDVAFYQDSVNYNSIWHLTDIKSPSGGWIRFGYHPNDRYKSKFDRAGYYFTSVPEESQDTTKYYTYNSGDEYTQRAYSAIHITNSRPLDLKSISSDEIHIEFIDALNYLPVQIIPKDEAGFYKDVMVLTPRPILNKIIVKAQNGLELNKEFVLHYGNTRNIEEDIETRKTHFFLKSVTEHTNGHALPPYTFDYYNVKYNDVSYLPKPGSNRKDHFGFFNNDASTALNDELFKMYVYPQLEGADRYRLWPLSGYDGEFYVLDGKDGNLNEATVMNGSLSRMNLPSGGHISYYYEPNTFHDAIPDFSRYGGGIRVSKVTRHDGIDFSNDIVKNYSYNDETGRSTGKLLFRPQYAMTSTYYWDSISQSNELYEAMMQAGQSSELIWKKITIRSDFDLTSQDGPTVGYDQVTVYQEGKGKVVYELIVDYPFESPLHTSVVKLARESASTSQDCSGIAPLIKSNSFPFAPNMNIGTKQGLVSDVYVYHENGFLLEHTSNNYQFFPSEHTIGAVKIEQLPYRRRIYNTTLGDYENEESNLYVYSPYSVLTTSSPFLTSTINTKYNENNVGVEIITESTREYATTSNTAYLNKTVLTNADGKKYITEFKYSKDFSNDNEMVDSDEMSKAIKKLNEKRMLTVPIETVNKIQLPGETERVVSAGLNILKYTSGDVIHADQRYILRTNGGIADFLPATLDDAQTTATFDFDSRYELISKNLELDIHDNVTTIEDRAQNHASTLYDHIGFIPLASISGAKASEVLFTNFDDTNTGALHYEMQIDPTISNDPQKYGEGRISGRSYKMQANNPTLHKLFKEDVVIKDEEYIISFWANEFELGHTATNITITVTMTGSNSISNQVTFNKPVSWEYYEFPINTSSLTNPVEIEMTTSADVRLDDILIYPINSSVQINTFNNKGQVLAETSQNKFITYGYDVFDRVQYSKDFEGNLISVNKYSTKDWEGDFYIVQNGDYVNKPINFTAYPENVGSATYYWDILAYDDTQEYDPETHDYSGIGGTTSKTYTLNNPTEDKFIFVKIVIGNAEYYAKYLLKHSYLKYYYDEADICVIGPIKVDNCGIHPSVISSCNYIAPMGTTTFSIDTESITQPITQFRWKFSTVTPSIGDKYPLDAVTTTTINNSSTYTLTDYSQVGTRYVWCVVDLDNGEQLYSDLRTLEVYSSGCTAE